MRQHAPFVLIEDAERRVAAAHAAGIEVVVGNAASGKALELANVAGATTLIIAIPNAFEAGQAVEQAHKHNASLRIIARAHSDEEETYLKDLGANEVIMGEREIGLGMLGWVAGVPAVVPAMPLAEPVATAPVLEEQPVEPEPARSGFDAFVAAPVAEKVMPTIEPEPIQELPADVLEARIEAAHPEHEITGPAEPAALVPALGEMPVEKVVSAVEPVVPVVRVEPIIPVAPPRPRPAMPASKPGAAFNPAVEPVED
jgi:CPA2 family monovalent cation:H+ antiporter-2